MNAEQLMKAQIRAEIMAWILNEKISQTEASRRLGLTQAALSYFLSGKKPSVSVQNLLDAWVRVGGSWQLKLTRLCEVHPHDEL